MKAGYFGWLLILLVSVSASLASAQDPGVCGYTASDCVTSCSYGHACIVEISNGVDPFNVTVKVNGVVAPMFCVDEKQLVVWSEGTNAADFTVQFLSTPFDGGDNHQFTGYKPNGVASVNDQGTVANLPDHGCYKFSVLQQDSSNYSSFSEDPIVVVNGVGGKGATALPPKRGTTQPAGQPQK